MFPTPSDSARVDPAAASREFDQLTTLAARGAVRPIAIGVGLLYVGFTAAHLLVLPTDLARVMAPVAAISAVTLLALAWLARGNAPVRGHRGLAIIAVITLANSLLHLSLTRDPAQTTNLYLILAGSGMLLFRSRDLAAVIAVIATGFIAVAANDQTGNPTWTHFGIGLVSAIMLSAVIHVARNRFIRRMAVLEVSARARELSLTASETRFRHLFDVSPTMICVHDMNGVVIDLNQAGAEALGADRTAIIGQSIERFLVNGPRGVHRDYLGTIHRLGRAAGLALVGTLDGRERTWLYDNMVFNDPELGQYVVGTALDVTELQEARSKLEAAKADLEEQVNSRTAELRAANLRLEDELQARMRMESRLLERHKLEGLGRLAGGVAHEFNNILGIIRGNAELAAQEIQGASEYMQEIEDATVRGADLVSKVLSFSRPDSRGHAPFPLGSLVTETVEQLRRDLPATITLELVASDDLGEIVGSREQIRQVLVDLVSNSRQAMDVAGGRISIRATGGCERPDLVEVGVGPYVRVEVLDTGRGISPRNLPRVFDPFFTTREVGQGYGLGLSVAHGIIRSHGGEIRVESPASGGTRVVFYLPQGVRDEVDASVERPVPVAEDGYILVVDDEPAILRVAQRCLERRGLQVQTAADGVTALSILRATPARVHLLVTDISMPGLTGDDLLREARVLQPGLRALVMSGYGPSIDLDRLGGASLTAVLSKPFRAADLDAAIEAILPSIGISRSSAGAPPTGLTN